MAHWKEHFKDCQEQLGNGWAVVHRWLDEFARIYRADDRVWMGHRVHRHHVEGVAEVKQKWGDEAARAAEIHIVRDEGGIPTREEIEKKYGVTKESGDKAGHRDGAEAP